jgi:hypothetical protein
MAKVLKSSRGGKVSFETEDGGLYQFSDSKECASMEAFMKDEHAIELLKKYPQELKEVPEKDWLPRHRKAVENYKKMRMEKLKEEFPDMIKDKVFGKDKALTTKDL